MKPTVLVIEDDSDIRNIVGRILNKFDFKVETAEDGRKGLMSLLDSATKPDAILVDLNMPVMDGYEFLQLQSQRAQLANIPTIIMTAENEIEFLKKKLPRQKIIFKPLDMITLVSAIKEAITYH